MGNFKKYKSAVIVAVLLALAILEIFAVSKYNNYHHNIKYAYVNYKEVGQDEPSIDYQKVINDLRITYSNEDVVGKITIDGTAIDEAIMQSTANNDYYLRRNEYGNYQEEGCIYEDYRTTLDSRKVLIYGHSSPNWQVPFNELENYYDKSFYDGHRYITITTEKGINTYLIFSVYVETSDFTYMNLNITNDTYNRHLKKYKDNSLYDTGVQVLDNDEILILQTCSNSIEYSNYKKKYLLVISKKIKKEEKR